MKIITNNYLKRITLNPKEILYYNSTESPDLIEIDNELEKKTIEAAFKFFAEKKEALKQHYEKYNDDAEKLVIMKLASVRYYFYQKDDYKLREQLKLCENLIASDICKRNILIKIPLLVEAKKLKMALETNLIVFACNFLNKLYQEIYPNLNQTDRYVRISELMNIFSTKNSIKFYTLKEAEEIINANFDMTTPNARAYIKDKIKHYIR